MTRFTTTSNIDRDSKIADTPFYRVEQLLTGDRRYSETRGTVTCWIPGSSFSVAFEFDRPFLFVAKFYDGKDYIGFLEKEDVNNLSVGLLTIRQIADCWSVFLKDYRQTYPDNTVRATSADFINFLARRSFIDIDRSFDTQQERKTTGRPKFFGETEWLSLHVFKKTSNDDGKVVVFGKPFFSSDDGIGTMTKNVVFMPNISDKEFPGRDRSVVFVLDPNGPVSCRIDGRYLETLTRQDMAKRIDIVFNIHHRQNDLDWLTKARKTIEALAKVETVVGILPDRVISQVATSYIDSHCPDLTILDDGRTKRLYAKNTIRSSSEPSLVVETGCDCRQKTSVASFLGHVVATGRWPNHPVTIATKKNAERER